MVGQVVVLPRFDTSIFPVFQADDAVPYEDALQGESDHKLLSFSRRARSCGLCSKRSLRHKRCRNPADPIANSPFMLICGVYTNPLLRNTVLNTELKALTCGIVLKQPPRISVHVSVWNVDGQVQVVSWTRIELRAAKPKQISSCSGLP